MVEMTYYTKAEVLAQAGGKFIPRAFVQHWMGGTRPFLYESIYLNYAEDRDEDLVGRPGKCLGWTLDRSVVGCNCASPMCGICNPTQSSSVSNIRDGLVFNFTTGESFIVTTSITTTSPKCTCGSESVGGLAHSSWCDKGEE